MIEMTSTCMANWWSNHHRGNDITPVKILRANLALALVPPSAIITRTTRSSMYRYASL